MKPSFSQRLIAWQREHGRHHLPWQVSDPYRVWLSEMMLQQTQVVTVIGYFGRFIARFPDVAALAAAPLDDVLAHWSGLGYYSRARNLHQAAQQVVERFDGRFPHRVDELVTLPGIGPSTASAIAAFCFHVRTPILDGNVKRVLTRWAGIEGFPGEKAIERQLWALAQQLLPDNASQMPAYTQAQMDLGATVCTPRKPACTVCPLVSDCAAAASGRQHELPTPKPKKAKPERHTVMLLVRNASGELLLEQRPPSGIWGGLWCLPECDSTLAAEDHCRDALGVAAQAEPALPDFSHVFTHFRLSITPLPLIASETAGVISERALKWFSVEDALAAGIPAPLRRLLGNAPRP
ncbi:A/G-specific adenine glycosylase [Chitinibacteraceae bacterium HSL-7]